MSIDRIAHKGAPGARHPGFSQHKSSSGRGRNRRAPTVPSRAGFRTELGLPLSTRIATDTAGPPCVRTQGARLWERRRSTASPLCRAKMAQAICAALFLWGITTFLPRDPMERGLVRVPGASSNPHLLTRRAPRLINPAPKDRRIRVPY